MQRYLITPPAGVDSGTTRGSAGGACCGGRVEDVLAKAETALRRHFGHGALRPFQREAIAAWSEGRDAVVVLATGAGKSVCFQLPPLCEPAGRWALVISPLVSLMQDQVRTLRQRQISAGLCGSGAVGDLAATWSGVESGQFRLVYMSPEFAAGALDRLLALRSRVCLLAIDEAHCISSWGHDFRPEFRGLGRLREALAGVPTMCATATCTAQVREDIARSLSLGPRIEWVAGNMNRPNLKYEVRQRASIEADLVPLFGLAATAVAAAIGGASAAAAADERRRLVVDNAFVGPASSTIVYAHTKARCEELASWLLARGVLAAAYHAGLGMAERRRVHAGFLMDELQVVVATVAFGMGIDKPSIRRIVHYGAIQTLEHYVQQCGRAGRDGDDAECIAFVADADAAAAKQLILADFARPLAGLPGGAENAGAERQARCERMLALHGELTAYLGDAAQCRRVRLLGHFGEQPTTALGEGDAPRGECVLREGRVSCRFCDVCLTAVAIGGAACPSRRADLTAECKVLLRCVDACGGFTGVQVPCLVAAGHGDKKVRDRRLDRHPAFGCGRDRALSWWRALLPHVRSAGLLQERGATLATGFAYVAISLTDAGHRFLGNVTDVFVLDPVPPELAPPLPAPAAEPLVVRSSALQAPPDELYSRLAHVRLKWQRREAVPGDALIPNAALRHWVQLRPSCASVAQRHVEGFPSALGSEDSGASSQELLAELLEETRLFCSRHNVPCDVGVPPLDQGKRPLTVPTSPSQTRAFASDDSSSSWIGRRRLPFSSSSVTKEASPALDLNRFRFSMSASDPGFVVAEAAAAAPRAPTASHVVARATSATIVFPASIVGVEPFLGNGGAFSYPAAATPAALAAEAAGAVDEADAETDAEVEASCAVMPWERRLDMLLVEAEGLARSSRLVLGLQELRKEVHAALALASQSGCGPNGDTAISGAVEACDSHCVAATAPCNGLLPPELERKVAKRGAPVAAISSGASLAEVAPLTAALSTSVALQSRLEPPVAAESSAHHRAPYSTPAETAMPAVAWSAAAPLVAASSATTQCNAPVREEWPIAQEAPQAPTTEQDRWLAALDL